MNFQAEEKSLEREESSSDSNDSNTNNNNNNDNAVNENVIREPSEVGSIDDANSQISEGSFICNDDNEEFDKVSEDENIKSADEDTSSLSDRDKKYDSKYRKPKEPSRPIEVLDGELDFEDDKDDIEEPHSTNYKDDFKEKEEEEEEASEEEDLEEGEVKEDDDDEENHSKSPPRNICRFYSKNSCTWGPSCRFYHPGSSTPTPTKTNNKGNYNMFDPPKSSLVISPSAVMATDFVSSGPRPLVESAWAMGARNAKQLVKLASKRKEQSPDFEEKCLNQTIPTFDSIPNAYKEDLHYAKDMYEKYPEKDRFNYLKDRHMNEGDRRRADEWHDPWRRSKSPKNKRSQSADSADSSNSGSSKSYSSKSSASGSYSRSGSSGSKYSSKSRSPSRSVSPRSWHEDESKIDSKKSPTKKRSRSRSKSSCSSRSSISSVSSRSLSDRSPSPPLQEGKTSPVPVAKKKVAADPVPHLGKIAKKPIKLSLLNKESNGVHKNEVAAKKNKSKVTKAPPPSLKTTEAKKRPIAELEDSNGGSSRREELLKQLRAVEDAIAKKRSKFS